MPSIFESQRYGLEDIERMENALSERIRHAPKKRRLVDKVANDHEMAELLGRIQNQSKSVLDMFNDENTRQQDKLEMMGLDEFYTMLKEIKDYRRRYPNEQIEDLEAQYQPPPPPPQEETETDYALQTAQKLFSGEELYGRFLDLVALHEEFINLPHVKPTSYLHYLNTFDSCSIPRKFKHNPQYIKYVNHLYEYLDSFLHRTQPLLDFNLILSQIEDQFQSQWDSHKVKGWNNGDDDDYIFCDACQVPIKNTVYASHIEGKKHKKNSTEISNKPSNKDIALCEFKIEKITKLVDREREATKINVERRAALTEREREIELESFERAELEFDHESRKRIPGLDTGFDLESEDEDDDDQQQQDDGDEDEEKIYNPLKLPLGWDGKPIPYWLWKLHGLGIEYKCEICGNFIYMGRKSFEKHFVESRHIHGLKCLGINDVIMFREITSINQAINLWNQLNKEKRKIARQKDNAIEMQDDEGNVMSQRTYNDLKKQGLL